MDMTLNEMTEQFQAQLAAIAPKRQFQPDELSRMLVHSRLLTAIVDDDPQWLLKGSFALQVLFPCQARVARDLDLAFSHIGRISYGFPADGELFTRDNRDTKFKFESQVLVARSREIRDINYALNCYSVTARWEGKEILKTEADLSLYEDAWFDDGETDISSEQRTSPLAPTVRIFPLRYQLAEKLHAYTLPHPPYGEDPTWKGRHLADIALILDNAVPSPKALAKSVLGVFGHRGTHGIPVLLPYPGSYRDTPQTFSRLTASMELSNGAIEDVYSRLTGLWHATIAEIHAASRDAS